MEFGGTSHNACPTQPGFTQTDVLLSYGPIAGGGTISTIAAQTNTAAAAGKSYTVNVRTGTGTVIASCTVATGSTTCGPTTGSLTFGDGAYLEVQIINNNGAAAQQWRVTFGY